MNIIYTTFLLLITAVLSSIITSHMPTFRTLYRHLKTRFTRKSTAMVALQEQIDNIAEHISVREKNQRQKIREEVRNYLKELQNDK